MDAFGGGSAPVVVPVVAGAVDVVVVVEVVAVVVVVVVLGRVVGVGRAVVGVTGGAVAGAPGDDATRPEPGSAISDDVSTASKAPAGIVFSWSSKALSQP
ncbi:MAG TPA: hypothetical protein VGR20_10120, partial [Acidimicrobiia bacterium]|nr:hypothetical protein [Acidimicrobiia bacterium]